MQIGRAEAAAIGRVGVLSHVRSAAIRHRNDVRLSVGVVADDVVGGVNAVAEVRAVNVVSRDLAARGGVAQNAFHAAGQVEDVAGFHAVHFARDAAAQGVVTVGDEFGGDAGIPENGGGAVVFVVSQPPALPAARCVRHVAARVVLVGEIVGGIQRVHAIRNPARRREARGFIHQRRHGPGEGAAFGVADFVAVAVVGVGQSNVDG